MAFYDDLAGTDAHADLVLALRIEGVPVALVERAVPAAVAAALSGYTQYVGITRVEEGEATLDMDERRELAATLQIELLDDDAKTLAGLFAINKRRLTFLTADATAAATTLTLFSTTGLVGGQTIYTDGETITVGTVASGTSLTGCTRGASGSTAAPLFGATAGFEDSVYTAPPAWRGRRAYLYGYTLRADGGGSEELLGTWIIDEPPRHTGDMMWSLALASCAQEFYERSIGVGLTPAKVTADSYRYQYSVTGTTGVFKYQVDNASSFRASANWDTYAIIKWQDLGLIVKVASVDTLANTLEIYEDPRFGTPRVQAALRGESRRDSRAGDGMQLAPFTAVGSSPQSMLYILLSKEGLGVTSTYDRLPGRLPTASDPGWRFGAGFAVAEVDVAAWEAIATARPQCIMIDREQRLSDVLREWCQLNGTATRVTADGKLSPFILSTPRVSSTTTLGPDSLVPDSKIEVVADEESIAPIATIRCDYTPVEGDFRAELNLVDTSTAKRYQRIQKRAEYEFRSIGVSDATLLRGTGFAPFRHAGTLTVGEIQRIAVDMQRGDNGLARRYLSVSLTMAHLGLRIGDVITLSGLPDAFSTLPDMRGSTLDGARCRVVSRRPRYDAGRVDVRLLVLDPLLVVSPAAVISSVVGTTLTLATTGDEVSGASPANDFYAGLAVRIYDISGAVYHSTTVTGIVSGTQLTINAAPAFVIAGGVDYIVADPAATATNGTTTSGYQLSELAAVAASDGKVTTSSASATTEPRWR